MFNPPDPYDYHVWLRDGSYAAPGIVFGLLAIWALFSRNRLLKERWYLSVGIPLVACALLLPTGMYEVALYALSTLGFLLLSSLAVRWLVRWLPFSRKLMHWLGVETHGLSTSDSDTPTKFRFGLRDAFWATTLIGVAFAIGTYAVRNSAEVIWQPLALSSICYGLLLGIAAALSLVPFRSRWNRWVIGIVTVFVTTLGLSYWWASLDWLQMADTYDRVSLSSLFLVVWSPLGSTAFWIFALTSVGLMVVLLAMELAVARHESAKFRIPLQAIAVVITTAILVPAIIASTWLYVLLCLPTPPPETVVVENNGYDDFIAALQPFENVYLADSKSATTDELQSFVAAHAAELVVVEATLQRPIRRTLQNSMADLDVPINAGRNAMYLFIAQGRLYESTGDHAAAAERYLQAVELGQAFRPGGLLIDVMVGNFVEDGGLEALRQQRSEFDDATRRRVLTRLQQIDAQQESWNSLQQRDQTWMIRSNGESARLVFAVEQISHEASFGDSLRSAHEAIHRSTAKRRLLITELALLAFQREHDRFPKALDELIPEFLDQVPTDPFSDQPLVYYVADDNYTLYSLGSNRRDDGGKLVNMRDMQNGFGDFFLDADDLDDEGIPDNE